MAYKIAIVGATGNVGRNILSVLEERNFPVGEVFLLASTKSVGREIRFKGQDVKVQDLALFDFSKVSIAFFSAGSNISKDYAPKAASCGAVVIDNTSFFRVEKDIPLVVPLVNPQDVALYKNRNIIANPNCSTAQMVVPLKPLHDKYNIKRIVVSTYQSVSGKGKDAMDELFMHTKSHFEGSASNFEKKVFPKQIAFNCLPEIDVFMEDGRTKEEWKMDVETKKILDKNIEVCATCVRVPVFVGHAESVNIEFEKPFDLDDIFDILNETNGVVVHDRRELGGYATQLDVVRKFPVYVSRIRVDNSKPNCLNMWIVADNIFGIGAALNSVQIAEELIKYF